MTNQEILDGARKWFLIDKNPPASEGATCVYYRDRSPGETPLKCAVGCLLPDEVAREMEFTFSGKNVTEDAVKNFLLERKIFGEDQFRLLADVQSAHDTWSSHDAIRFREKFSEELQRIAEYRDLEWSRLA